MQDQNLESILEQVGGAVIYEDGTDYATQDDDISLAERNMALYQAWQGSTMGRLVGRYLDAQGLPPASIDGYVSTDLNQLSGKQGTVAAIINTGNGQYLALNRSSHELNDRAVQYALGHEEVHARGVSSETGVRSLYAPALWYAAKNAASDATGQLAAYLFGHAESARRNGYEMLPA
ncbi:hypothetical protein AUJ68_02485 [Candidatus Woesearchaeota archaeon CG1_02_57_44]|nr:MAG: hypothetical protein AUJ68_02485 [Candidatus Woesearchaeota archaeon CG1_02_57_44]PIN69058.1 MAG: hypothetical protein COV94_03385 [Candidatus Woesearchaeota archaeon CG11_big_fil_rev_8_21_14_0_20_57_5]